MFVKYKFNITNDTSQMRIRGTALMTLAKASSTKMQNRLHSHHKEYTSLHCCRSMVLTHPRLRLFYPTLTSGKTIGKKKRTPNHTYTTAHKIHKLTPSHLSAPPNRYEMLSSSIVLESSISESSPFVPFIFCSAVAWLLSLEFARLPSVSLAAPAEEAAHSAKR